MLRMISRRASAFEPPHSESTQGSRVERTLDLLGGQQATESARSRVALAWAPPAIWWRLVVDKAEPAQSPDVRAAGGQRSGDVAVRRRR